MLWECRAKVLGTEGQKGNQGLGLEQALLRLGGADFSVKLGLCSWEHVGASRFLPLLSQASPQVRACDEFRDRGGMGLREAWLWVGPLRILITTTW